MTLRRASTCFLELQENRSALVAVQQLQAALRDKQPAPLALLFFHGPSGTGKSQLLNSLVAGLSACGSDLTIQRLEANDLNLPPKPHVGSKIFAASKRSEPADDWREPARDCDLLVIEDLQHLGPATVEVISELLDQRLAHGLATVLTARVGPQHLEYRGSRFSQRFISRLAGGLVCHMPPWKTGSRLEFLRQSAQQRRLPLSGELLRWLADHVTGGGRQLLAALERIAALRKTQRTPDDAALIADFQAELCGAKPDLDGIAQKVSKVFQVDAETLQSASRSQGVLLPRQISMYLARKLTPLSLEQIGAYFGGRDHTTVLHACRKVEQALARDPHVEGAVRQIHAELG